MHTRAPSDDAALTAAITNALRQCRDYDGVTVSVSRGLVTIEGYTSKAEHRTSVVMVVRQLYSGPIVSAVAIEPIF